MREMRWPRFAGALGVLAGGIALAMLPHDGAWAQNFFARGDSLASNLLVNRTQKRILRTDDEVDSNCGSRRFVEAVVVKAPEVRINGARVYERKWQEYWSLDRCGIKIGYYVFFTEVGDGGAYFSILSSE